MLKRYAPLMLLLAGCATMPDQRPRYVIESHEVTPLGSSEALTVTLKLDSSFGCVWRLVDGEFIHVSAEREPTHSRAKRGELSLETKKKTEAAKARMREIIIPEMEFRQARLPDVIAFLAKAGAEHSDDGKGVNIVVDYPKKYVPAPATAATDIKDPFAAPAMVESTESDFDAVPLITFTARHISLMEAINIVSQVSNMRLTVKGSIVYISPLELNCYTVLHTKYNLLHSTLVTLKKRDPQLFDERAAREDLDARWKTYFTTHGVSWPRGTSISVLPSIGLLTVSNTPDNIDMLDAVLQMADSYPSHPGRYRLATREGMSAPILLDTGKGETWEYHITQMSKDGKTIEMDKLMHVPTREL
jgi:hypothetical protein